MSEISTISESDSHCHHPVSLEDHIGGTDSFRELVSTGVFQSSDNMSHSNNNNNNNNNNTNTTSLSNNNSLNNNNNTNLVIKMNQSFDFPTDSLFDAFWNSDSNLNDTADLHQLHNAAGSINETFKFVACDNNSSCPTTAITDALPYSNFQPMPKNPIGEGHALFHDPELITDVMSMNMNNTNMTTTGSGFYNNNNNHHSNTQIFNNSNCPSMVLEDNSMEDFEQSQKKRRVEGMFGSTTTTNITPTGAAPLLQLSSFNMNDAIAELNQRQLYPQQQQPQLQQHQLSFQHPGQAVTSFLNQQGGHATSFLNAHHASSMNDVTNYVFSNSNDNLEQMIRLPDTMGQTTSNPSMPAPQRHASSASFFATYTSGVPNPFSVSSSLPYSNSAVSMATTSTCNSMNSLVSKNGTSKTTKEGSKKKAPRDPYEPKRPLTAYNFFFKHLRGLIISENPKLEHDPTVAQAELEVREKVGAVVLVTSPANTALEANETEDAAQPTTTTAKQRSSNKKRRPHRRVGFRELAGQVSTKWKSISPEVRQLYDSLAALEKSRYAREKADYKRQRQQQLVKKQTESQKEQEQAQQEQQQEQAQQEQQQEQAHAAQ